MEVTQQVLVARSIGVYVLLLVAGVAVSDDSHGSEIRNGLVSAPMDSPAATTNSELNLLFNTLDQHADSLIEQLRHQVLQPPIESPNQKSNNPSEAIDRKFFDGHQNP